MATHSTSTSVPPWPSRKVSAGATMTTLTNNLFLSTLPPEIRNHVYSFVLPRETQEFRFSLSNFAKVPALLQVCQQIRSEALGLYYQDCAFDLVLHHRATWQFKAWCDSLPRQACTHLLKNKNVNLRLVLDTQHKDFAAVKHLLDYFTIGWKISGWYISGESFLVERLPLNMMVNIASARRMGPGAVRRADPIIPSDQEKTALRTLKMRIGISRSTVAEPEQKKDIMEATLVKATRAVWKVLRKRALS
ncbi:hypothetical protein LTR27_011637 [Elasticomyces elasticus]|nr:hypothetical protein LTR27_011637 [Elasticomyces elasticus]